MTAIARPLCNGLAKARLLLVAAFVTLMAACADAPSTPPGTNAAVAMRQVPLALGQTSTGGGPLFQPSPIYPPSVLSAHLPPVEVRASLAVDGDGRVSTVAFPAPTASASDDVFVQAVRDAVARWTFEPLRVDHWAADAYGNAHDAGSTAEPFRVDYLFRFVWQDGRPQVTSERLPDGE